MHARSRIGMGLPRTVEKEMSEIANAALLCALIVLVGCAGMPPAPPTACSTEPGSYACQVQRMSLAGGG